MAKYIDLIGWDDAPHLMPPHIPQEELDELVADMQPHQKQARRTGRPSLGAGAIYPIDEDEIFIEPFAIPDYFERAYALDVGWKRTAALFAARDPDSDAYYLTGEYYASQKEPIVHAHCIKKAMQWTYTGAIDPAAEGSSQRDGAKLKAEYEELGLELVNAENAVEAGIHKVLVLYQGAQLFVFNTLKHFRTELRLYRRNEKGKIVKENDHLMDCKRYLLNTPEIFRTQPQAQAFRGGRGEW